MVQVPVTAQLVGSGSEGSASPATWKISTAITTRLPVATAVGVNHDHVEAQLVYGRDGRIGSQASNSCEYHDRGDRRVTRFCFKLDS